MRKILAIIIAFVLTTPIFAQNKRALVIGISSYNPQNIKSSNLWNNIHGANDAELIKQTLGKQGFKITSLKDKKATATNIRKAFGKLVQESKPGDLVYIHFSGHGQAVEDRNGDESDGWDEAIVPVDAASTYTPGVYTGDKHILDDELNKYFKSLRNKLGTKGMLYVVIDACHAGSLYRGEDVEDSIYVRGTDKGFTFSGKRYTPRIDKRGNIPVEKGNNLSTVTLLEACRSYEVNTEIRQEGKYFGPLSFYVGKALSTHQLSKENGWINIVTSLMNNDKRLIKQHMVIESTK